MRTENGTNNHPICRLATVWHTCRADLNSTAKILQKRLVLEPQPTGGWLELAVQTQPDLIIKTKISTFTTRFKQDIILKTVQKVVQNLTPEESGKLQLMRKDNSAKTEIT